MYPPRKTLKNSVLRKCSAELRPHKTRSFDSDTQLWTKSNAFFAPSFPIRHSQNTPINLDFPQKIESLPQTDPRSHQGRKSLPQTDPQPYQGHKSLPQTDPQAYQGRKSLPQTDPKSYQGHKSLPQTDPKAYQGRKSSAQTYPYSVHGRKSTGQTAPKIRSPTNIASINRLQHK